MTDPTCPTLSPPCTLGNLRYNFHSLKSHSPFEFARALWQYRSSNPSLQMQSTPVSMFAPPRPQGLVQNVRDLPKAAESAAQRIDVPGFPVRLSSRNCVTDLDGAASALDIPS